MLGTTTLLQLAVSVPQQTPAAIGPVLTQALGLSRTELGLLTSAIWGGVLLGMLPSGVLADRYGERRIIIGGTVLLAGLLLLAAQTSGFLALFVILLLASIGAATSFPGGTKVLAGLFRPAQRGLALGVRQTGVTMAGVAAALMLPPIAISLGWQAAFRTVALIVLLAIACFVILYRESAPDQESSRYGSLAFRMLVRNRTFVVATAYAWVFMGALACSVTYLGISLHERAGFSIVQAGMVLAVLQVGGIAGRIGWGILSDRLGRRSPMMLLAGILGIVSCLGMALVNGRVAMPIVLSLAFLLGCSAMGWNGLHITLLTEAVSPQSVATALGLGLTISFTGMFVASPIFGLLADLSGSYELSWLALALWAAIGTALVLGIRERRVVPLAAAPNVT